MATRIAALFTLLIALGWATMEANATDPANDPTDPAYDPTDPNDPTDPANDPTDPATDPNDPTAPSAPSTSAPSKMEWLNPTDPDPNTPATALEWLRLFCLWYPQEVKGPPRLPTSRWLPWFPQWFDDISGEVNVNEVHKLPDTDTPYQRPPGLPPGLPPFEGPHYAKKRGRNAQCITYFCTTPLARGMDTPCPMLEGYPSFIAIGKSEDRKWWKCFNCCNVESSPSENSALQVPPEELKMDREMDDWNAQWNDCCGCDMIARMGRFKLIVDGYPYLMELRKSGSRKWFTCYNCCNVELSPSEKSALLPPPKLEMDRGVDKVDKVDMDKVDGDCSTYCVGHCCDCDTPCSFTRSSFKFCGCSAKWDYVTGKKVLAELKQPNREKWIALGLSGFVFFSMIMVLLVFWTLEKQRKSAKKVVF